MTQTTPPGPTEGFDAVAECFADMDTQLLEEVGLASWAPIEADVSIMRPTRAPTPRAWPGIGKFTAPALLVAALFALPAGPAEAQQVWDCVSRACQFVTDPLATTGAPATRCRLYANGTVVSDVPVSIINHGRPEAYCHWQWQFAAGTYLLHATVTNADGAESASSNVLHATMQAGVMPPPDSPPNLRRIAL